jgi:putative restriction endonuclease
VAERRPQKPDVRLPFYHLRSDRIWVPLDASGRETLERRRVAAVKIDQSFLECLASSESREQMRLILIAKYFVDFSERAALYQLVGLSMPTAAIAREDARLYQAARERGREARFRLTVVPAYDYTCALTHYRLVTVASGSIVEAAHIHQFADSRNNHPRNGIALCKNAHWMFDKGLWSIDDHYRILVDSKRFAESGAADLLLSSSAKRQIRLPENSNYWPEKSY